MAAWKKAGFGGTTKKSGGGKAEWVAKGSKGDHGKGLPGKASLAPKRSSVDTPTTEGNKGIVSKG